MTSGQSPVVLFASGTPLRPVSFPQGAFGMVTGFGTGCHFEKGRNCLTLLRPFKSKPEIPHAGNTRMPAFMAAQTLFL
jgi:hypothetical protein